MVHLISVIELVNPQDSAGCNDYQEVLDGAVLQTKFLFVYTAFLGLLVTCGKVNMFMKLWQIVFTTLGCNPDY